MSYAILEEPGHCSFRVLSRGILQKHKSDLITCMVKTFQWLPLSLREHLKLLKPQNLVIIYGICQTLSEGRKHYFLLLTLHQAILFWGNKAELDLALSNL